MQGDAFAVGAAALFGFVLGALVAFIAIAAAMKPALEDQRQAKAALQKLIDDMRDEAGRARGAQYEGTPRT